MADKAYIVVTDRPWGQRIFHEKLKQLPGEWVLERGGEPEVKAFWAEAFEKTVHYIFFLFYSDKVPAEIVNKYECIGFHMTKLPDGRGGSPLQNMIIKGKTDTEVCAFRLQEGLDTGPVYCRLPMSLNGLAEEIYIRAAYICAEQIEYIVKTEPEPVPQQGGVISLYRRRTPEQSEIPHCQNLGQLFDHLRMLDADGYPKAYLDHAGYRYEFSRPALRDGRIVADVEIRPWKKEGK